MRYPPGNHSLISRLSTLTIKERQRILTITCPKFTKKFLELIKNQQEYDEQGIICFFPTNEAISISSIKGLKKDKIVLEEEKVLYKSIRLFSRYNYLDSITVCSKFVENMDAFIRCLDIITKGKCFTGPFNAKRTIGDIKFEERFALRFSVEEGGSIFEWICAYLEQTLLRFYLNNERLEEINVFQEYEQLAWLWRELAQSERIAVKL